MIRQEQLGDSCGPIFLYSATCPGLVLKAASQQKLSVDWLLALTTAQQRVDSVTSMARRNMAEVEHRANAAFNDHRRRLAEECAAALRAQESSMSASAEERIRQNE